MAPGRVIGERYELLAPAGSGAVAAVWRGRDVRSGATVALKLLRAGGDEDAGRFAREATLLAALRHPAIVRYLDHGRDPKAGRFLVMEWLEGETLEHRLRHAGASLGEAVRLGARIADALAEAHRHGVVHRDVKPGNVMLPAAPGAGVVLIDFGVARREGDAAALTGAGALIGTPGYMAPEQATGHGDVGPRADLFALGCLLWECVTGRAAFVGGSLMAVRAKILWCEVPPLREAAAGVPPALDALVASLLAKDPEARPDGAAAVAAGLAGIAGEVERAGGTPAPRPRAVLGDAEQRVVAVAFGSDPGDAIDGAVAAVAPLGVRLERLADGAVAATLGGSGAATDLATRAVRCAMALRGAAPRARYAVATGRGVLAGGALVGEVIERSARLAGAAAPPGTIRLDETTAGLLGEGFALGGDAEGLLLLGERGGADSGVRPLLGRVTPFVGRDAELDALDALAAECARERCARAALVIGAPGSGKSRLRQELVRAWRRRGDEGLVLLGRGEPLAAGSPFGVLTPVLRRAAGIVDGEPPGVRRRKLRARLARHLGGGALDDAADFLGELCGVAAGEAPGPSVAAARSDPILMGDRMRGAWIDWLAAECAAAPVALLLEDLQWGDLPSVAFVDAALRALADAPLCVIGFARPEVTDLFPRLWAGRDLQEIRLGALSRRAASRLVRESLGEVAEPQVARVVERAEGNAFFLEELIRALAAGREEELPDSVLGGVQARLDELDPQTRRVLRAASVFGRRFSAAGVAELLGGLDPTTLAGGGESRLDELCERELVDRTDRDGPAALAGTSYGFRHALVRDAAYATLTDDDRRLGHRLAGEWLEAAGEGDAAVLAEHFARGGEPARALRWYRRGAEQALEGNDLAAALALAERGVGCGAAGEMLGALRLVEAEAHRWRGELGEARRQAVAAAAALPRAAAAWFRAVGEIAYAGARLGDYAQAAACGRDAAAERGGAAARGAQLACLSTVARQMYALGRYDVAEELVARAEQVAAPDAAAAPELDPLAAAQLHGLRGARARHLGDLSGDLDGYAAALGAFERAGDARNACNTRVSVGFALIELGDYAAAAAELARGLADAERLGLAAVAARAHQNLALVLAARGDLAAARAAVERAVAGGRAQGDPRFEGWSRVYLAGVLLRGGDAAGAEQEAQAADELLAATPPARAGALAMLARARIAQGRAAAALAAAREAMELLTAQGSIEEFESLVRLAHVEALAAAGEPSASAAARAAASARLGERAARIADPARRASFLASVPENAATLGG